MTAHPIFHPGALQDIEDTVYYLASKLNNIPAGERFIEQVQLTAEQVAEAPLAYTPHPHFRESTRGYGRKVVAGFENYTLYYHLNSTDEVVVMAVLYGPRNDHGRM